MRVEGLHLSTCFDNALQHGVGVMKGKGSHTVRPKMVLQRGRQAAVARAAWKSEGHKRRSGTARQGGKRGR
jgi:hypothetical protein